LCAASKRPGDVVALGIIPPLLGAPVRTADGLTAGAIGDLLVEPRTGRPVWAVVELPGRGEPALVPADALHTRCRAVELPFTRDRIAAAPASADATELCRHYGVAPWDLLPPAELETVRVPQPAAALAA
jgi:hypothetical protein